MSDRLEEVKSYDLKEEEVTTTVVRDAPRSLDEKLATVEEIQMDPHMGVLQLDIPASHEAQDKTFVMTATEPRTDTAETGTPCEREPEKEDKTTDEIHPEEVTVRREAQSDSSQPELLQPREAKATSAEISLSEKDHVKPEEVIELELLKITQDRPTEAKQSGIREEHPEVSIWAVHDSTSVLDDKSVTMEKNQVEPKMLVLEADIASSCDELDKTLVLTAAEPKTDVAKTDIPCEREKENRDKSTDDIHPEEPEMNLTEPGAVQPETGIGIEFSKTKQDRPEEVKSYDLKEEEVSTIVVCDAPRSLDEKSVTVEKIQVDPQMGVLQLDIPASHEDKTFVMTATEPRTDTAQIRKEDKSTDEIHPEEPKVRVEVQQISTERQEDVAQTDSPQPALLQPRTSAEISLSEQDTVNPEAVIELELVKITRERTQVSKKSGVQEEHPDVDDAPASRDKKVTTLVKLQVEPQVCVLPASHEEHERTFVLMPNVPRTDTSQTSIQCESVPVNKDMTSAENDSEETKTRVEVEQISTKRQEGVPQSDSAQPAPLQPREAETTSAEINLSEPGAVKSEAVIELELLKNTQDRPMVTKELWIQEEHSVSTHGVDDAPTSLHEKVITVEKSEVEPWTLILPSSYDEHKKASVLVTNVPRTDTTETRIQCEIEHENKDATATDVRPEEAKVRVEVQQISTDRQEDASQSDSAQPAPREADRTSAEISVSEQDTVKPKAVIELELLKTTQERPEEVKDFSLKEEVSTQDVLDPLQRLDQKSVTMQKISIGPELSISTPDTQATTVTSVALAEVPSTDRDKTVQFEKATKTHKLSSSEIEPEKTAAEMTKVDIQESFNELRSKAAVVPKAQEEKHTTDAIKMKEQDVGKKTAQEEGKERTTSVELPVQMSTTTTTITTITTITTTEITEVGLQSVKLPQEPVVQVSSALVKELHLKDQEKQAEASDVTTEKTVLESPEEPSIFTEIQLLKATGPNWQLTEGKPLEDAPEALLTSTSDMDGQLSRLVSKLLNCKNHPAELNPTAMAQQVEEAQECREVALAQVALLSHLRGPDAENREALEHLEDQWSTAAQDAATVIQSKEAQLQLVTDYCTQIQTAKTIVDRQTAELDAVQASPQDSSSKDTERLGSLQRSMEENRTVLGELLVTYTKLCPHLRRCERATAAIEQKTLQERWRALERTVQSSLHHRKAHSHLTSGLLSELSGLLEHLEMIDKDLEAKSPPVTQWNCKKAQQLMEANAEVKAAQQQYLHLQQLSEGLSPHWEMETKEIQRGLQGAKDKISHTAELVSTQTLNSSNPIMEKIITVMRDGLAWAKQTERDIEGRRKRVALLPEEVHRQLRDLKKLQSEVMAKQGQLESLVEDVTELLPQLDQAEEVPMVHTLLKCLEELEKSTTEKLSKAVKDVESGLQTREKLSEQIADLDSWVVAHLQREASRGPDSELKSPVELDRRARQIQETLAEAEKQEAVCEALLMNSKDIASELSITENCQLFDKLINLQENIRAISTYEKNNKKEMNELIQTLDSSKKNLDTVEKSLRQMLVDLSRYRFPITRESLQAVEPFKHMILEHKSQVDLLQPWIPKEKTRELYSIISELHVKMGTLEMKASDHERYLNMRQCVEDLRENFRERIHQTKDDGSDVEEKYKVCQSLLVEFHLMKGLCEDARSKLQMISADLYPSQLTAEQQRLKQNEESLNTGEMSLCNNLSIIEWNVLNKLDLESEKRATRTFLVRTQKELEKIPVVEPNETTINREYQRIVSLKKTVESRMSALGVLQQKKGKKQRSGSQDLIDLKNAILCQCDSHMENITQARESLRSYSCSVKQAVQFLRDIEVSLLPLQGSAGLCGDRVEETQQALASLQQQFQTHVEQLQNQAALHPYLSPQRVEQLQENVLSQLLVRMSTLQAKGHVRLDCLSRCAEQHRNYTKCLDETMQSVKSAEHQLLQLVSQKVTCLADCTDQEANLRALTEEMEALLRHLEELKEWCPEQSCRGGRETAGTSVWRWLSRLHRCAQELTTRSKQRIAEWRDITNSVEEASVLLQQVEAELPDGSRVTESTEELQDVLQSWEQYQDRLDCEHRALSALELRTARLLGVPAHLEEAPPIPLCQQLQTMQRRYENVKQRSSEGLQAARQELEVREKVREELQAVQGWLKAADGLLSEMKQRGSSTHELQELYSQLCSQKSLLHCIMERLKMKYSDMYTLVPVEIDGQLQDVTKSLQEVEAKVGEAIESSGPVNRLGARLSDIEAGLRSVQKRLEQRSPTVIEAKFTQKRAWDELDVWHSCLAALEVDLQDLEKPEEVLILTERLVEVQQLHALLAKQAEQRTTLISKIHTWLQEHQEMIKSSKKWMSEAQSWLAAPCTYTTAKCLSSHVHALQVVLDDSAQIRTTLQGFSSVLKEMSQVCDVAALQEQLVEADRQVASVQDSFTAPLSQLEHAAAEVEAIESEVKRMENDVAEIKAMLTSPEAFPNPREDGFKEIETRIHSMRRTVAEIQKCKPGLCLPEKAEETLTVFTVVDQLQTLLLELEKKVPALFIQQPPTPTQAKGEPLKQTTPQPEKSTSEEAEKEDQGQIRIARVEEDVLKRSGAALLTVTQSSPEQRQSWTPDSAQREHQGVLRAEEATEKTGIEEQRVEEGGGGVFWWLWDAFLGSSPKEAVAVFSEETEAATGRSSEQPAEDKKDVEGPTDTTETSPSEALSKPLGTVTTQSLPESMVNTASTVNVSKSSSGSQQKCVVS